MNILGRVLGAISCIALAGWSHGSVPAPVGPAPPALAAAVGFTVLVDADPLTSLATIDINDTRTPGYTWYVHGLWPACTGCASTGPTAPSCFNATSGNVQLTCDNTSYNGALATCAATVGAAYVGNSIQGRKGFYAEITLKSSTTFFAWWAQAMEIFASYIRPSVAVEIDFPDITMNPAVRNWSISSGGAITQTALSPASGNYSVDQTQFHTYGFLFVPSAYNGGSSGYYKFYLDGAEQVFARTTYSSGANFSAAEHNTFCMFVGMNPGVTMTVKNYSLWQHP